MTVKVNGGFLGGRIIKTPLGAASRPTSDKIKEMNSDLDKTVF